MRLFPTSLLTLLCAWTCSGADGLSAVFHFPNPPLNKEPLIRRVDANVNYSTTDGSVAAGYPTSYWSGTWTGSIVAPVAGTYTFAVTCDDGARLWVKDRWLITKIALRSFNSLGTATATMDLAAGETVPVLARLWQLGGAAKMKLEWKKPGDAALSLVPTANLRTTGWNRIEAESASYENPASAIAFYRPGSVPVITAGATTPVTRNAGPTTLITNIPLSATAATAVKLVADETVTRSITWRIINLASPPTGQIDVRPGAKLQVKPTGTNKIYLTQGYVRTQVGGTPNSNGCYVVTIPTAGTWTIDDAVAAPVTVAAIGLDVPANVRGGTLLIQYDTPTIVPVSTLPVNATDRVAVGSFEHLLFVTENRTATALEASVSSATLAIDQVGYVRVKSTGAIIDLVKTHSYYTNSGDALIIQTNADGSEVGKAQYVLNPLTPNLKFTFSMRAHTATFAGGAKSFTVRTDGSATSIGTPGFAPSLYNGVTVGIMEFNVLFPPGESKWCFTAVGQQVAP